VDFVQLNFAEQTRTDTVRSAEIIFKSWLGRLSQTVESQASDAFAALFESDGYWRDILSFTWDRRTFCGARMIRDAFTATSHVVHAKNFRIAAQRTVPRFTRRSGKNIVEGWFDFDTAFGSGAGYARLTDDAENHATPRIQLLLTTLFELTGFEERTGSRRPSGEHYSKIEVSNSWKQDREREQSFIDRDPDVVIVGAGQSGLMLAARLRQIGVDALVVEKTARVGDVWRGRYNNLTLHNKLNANHFPYLPFPTTWPTWLPKDMLADWLESYAKLLELNVWTDTILADSSYDEKAGMWSVTLLRNGHPDRPMTCKHLVISTGVSGGLPKKPEIPGLDEFAGNVVHSSQFKTGMDWIGRNAIVIGTGNSGHDIAQDLYISGANSVTIMQRGPTCVLSLDPSAVISYSVYTDEDPVEDVDLMVSALPYPLLVETYKWITKRTAEYDRNLLDKLKEIGFKTYAGADETGFQLLYLRGAGGYYIDVGCSELLIDRKVGLVQAADAEHFVAEGLLLKNGQVMPSDLVVLATGFETMQESVRRLLGDQVATRVGPVWGFDSEGNLRGMWTQLGQPGLWLMGGSILEARLNSRFLALQIKASLEGLLPAQKDLPLGIVDQSSPN
jgi:cation diffusion facilitator CzcD-associated flavoprotein CzcO